jgi:ATP-dependent Clp protease adaptor protein ClpS
MPLSIIFQTDIIKPKMDTGELDDQGTTITEKKPKQKLKPPNRYQVVFHNDNFTPMEFVVYLLQMVFNHSEAAAESIMLNVHQQGKGVAGIYSSEIAETKVYESMMHAKENQFPLMVTSEEI